MARKGDGLYLRGKDDKATRVWWLDFRHHGTRHVAKIGKGISRSVARELASLKRAPILRGEAGIAQKKTRRDVSFDPAHDEFSNWITTNRKSHTVRGYQLCLKQLKRSFTGRQLSHICSLDVERHKGSRVESGARVRANREIAVLKTLYNKCKEWGLYEGENPVSAVKPLKEPRQRLRYLEYEEEARLLNVSPLILRDVIELGLHTGLRIGAEAFQLRVPDVDLRRGLLTVQAAYAKNGMTRTIPLNSRAREVLTRRVTSGEYVFSQANGMPYKNLQRRFRNACKAAGLHRTGVTIHTLRHTFASRLVMAGVDLRTVQELGGWSDLAMVQRYAHLSPHHKAEAVERIAAPIPNAFHNGSVLDVKEVACG